MNPNNNKSVYRIIFINQNDVCEIYARTLYQSELYGFIEIEELVFGEKSQLVVDPGEEKLKSTFSDVKQSFIPLHSIIRIDKMEKEGQAKIISNNKQKITPISYPNPNTYQKPPN